MLDTYCFVCHRPTDHVAEHDDLLEAGLVEYREGIVAKTQAWNEARAEEVIEESRRAAGLL